MRNGNSARQAVELIASTLSPGDTERGVCPKCNGGSSNEKSFVCSRDAGGVARFRCFRGKCGFRGSIGLAISAGIEPRKQSTHIFNRPIEELTDGQVEFFRTTFDINPANDIYWCPSLDRYAHKVFGPLGQARGWLLRDYTKGLEPKSLAYPSRSDEPFVGWHYPPAHTQSGGGLESEKAGPKAVVVVEDWVSARKVSDAGFIGVALHGTTLTLERCYEIRETSNCVRLALDKGMLGTMIKYRERFSPIFDDIIIWQLDKDLKYVSIKRIIEAVNGRTDFITNP